MFVCQYCQKELKHERTLIKHQKTAKYCLKIQTKITDYKCVCGIEYTSEKCFETHKITCVKYQVSEVSKQYEEKLRIKDEKILEKDDIISQKDDKIDELEDKIEALHFKLENKATVTNNIFIQKIEKMESLTSSHMEDCVKYLNEGHVMNGAQGMVDYALEYPIKDRVICTDSSRRKIKYKDSDMEIISDPGCQKLIQELVSANRDRIHEIYLEIYDKYNTTDSEFVQEIGNNVSAFMRGNMKDTYWKEFCNSLCSRTSM